MKFSVTTASALAKHKPTLPKSIKLFLPLASIVVVIAVIFLQEHSELHFAEFRASAHATAEVGKNRIQHRMQMLISDLAFLSNQNDLSYLVSSPDNDYDIVLADDWMTFIRAKKDYDQIRWLDMSGQERIRVNYAKGYPAIVPKLQLQDKSNRYYFHESVKLNSGEVYFSPLDLNIEHGTVEKPLKPMIRVGTPVFSADGQKQGVLLLNYLAEKLITEYAQSVTDKKAQAWLMNRDAYWLKGPSSGLEWGFMFGNRQANINSRYPTAWQKISSSDSGQFEDTNGLWTFTTIYPIASKQLSSVESASPSGSDTLRVANNEYYWKSVIFIPHDVLYQELEKLNKLIYPVTLIVLLLLAAASWWIAAARTREKEHDKQLHLLNKQLAENNKELLKSREQAELANNQKSAFLANMSHELRTPMHSILSFSSLALKRIDDEKAERFIQNIRTSGIRLLDLLNDILDLSKLEADEIIPDFIEQDLTGIIQQSIDEVNSLLVDKSITVSYDIECHYNCMVDQKLLVQVFINLLSNAIKFSPSNSLIEINIEEIELNNFEEKKAYYRVSVIDQGVGIPESELKDVFDKFVQSTKTMTQKGGTGLGLAISREIIEAHEGTIWCESPPKGKDKGTAFILKIPKQQLAAAFSTLDNALNKHLDWIENINAMMEKKYIDPTVSFMLLSNDRLCSLGGWIKKQDQSDPIIQELDRKHRAFHEVASECVAYCQNAQFDQANHEKKRFDEVSSQTIDMLQELKNRKQD